MGDSSLGRKKSRVGTHVTCFIFPATAICAGSTTFLIRARTPGSFSLCPPKPLLAITTGRASTPRSLRTSRMKASRFFSYSAANAALHPSFQPWCQQRPTISQPAPSQAGKCFFGSFSTSRTSPSIRR